LIRGIDMNRLILAISLCFSLSAFAANTQSPSEAKWKIGKGRFVQVVDGAPTSNALVYWGGPQGIVEMLHMDSNFYETVEGMCEPSTVHPGGPDRVYCFTN